MTTAADDANIVRRALGPLADPYGPAMQAIARLELGAALYAWAAPLLSGDDTPEAGDRTRKVAAELLRGHKGEAALRRASGI
jgi:hypothetical protein